MMRKFRYLQHVSDAYIAAYGSSLEESFENAAEAMFNVMTDVKQIKSIYKDKIIINAENEVHLLHDWLSLLHLKFETENRVYRSFNVRISKTNSLFCLIGEAFGELFNVSRHPSKTEVKAVTYHKLKVQKKLEKWIVTFILDL